MTSWWWNIDWTLRSKRHWKTSTAMPARADGNFYLVYIQLNLQMTQRGLPCVGLFTVTGEILSKNLFSKISFSNLIDTFSYQSNAKWKVIRKYFPIPSQKKHTWFNLFLLSFCISLHTQRLCSFKMCGTCGRGQWHWKIKKYKKNTLK